MTATAADPRPYDPIDLSSRAFWSTTAAEREKSFAELRAERPVSWHPPVEDALMPDPDDPGHWAVTRHDDIVAVSRDSDTFLSGKGVLFENVPEELLEASQSFLAMDPPRHTFIRKLVTPRSPRARSGASRTRSRPTPRPSSTNSARRAAAPTSSSTAPRNCRSARCRTWSASPRRSGSRWRRPPTPWCRWADPVFLNGRNPLEVLVEAQMYLHQVAGALAADRREHPGDDLLSSLVHAEVDGDRLTDFEVAAFFVLLAVAGNDTTRQTTSHALKALTDFADQRAWLLADFDDRIGSAVEEFVRWATPVMTFRRTAAAMSRSAAKTSAPGRRS